MTETVTVTNIVNIYGECSVNVREFWIYFYADIFDSVTYINNVNKSYLVRYLRRPIRWSRRKDPCLVEIKVIGSLSNDDSEGNENGKRAIGLD